MDFEYWWLCVPTAVLLLWRVALFSKHKSVMVGASSKICTSISLNPSWQNLKGHSEQESEPVLFCAFWHGLNF